MRIPPQVEDSFGIASAVKLPDHPWWSKTADDGVQAAQGPVAFQLGTLPSRCLLRAKLTLPSTGRAGFWFGGNKDGKEGFRLFVDVGARLSPGIVRAPTGLQSRERAELPAAARSSPATG